MWPTAAATSLISTELNNLKALSRIARQGNDLPTLILDDLISATLRFLSVREISAKWMITVCNQLSIILSGREISGWLCRTEVRNLVCSQSVRSAQLWPAAKYACSFLLKMYSEKHKDKNFIYKPLIYFSPSAVKMIAYEDTVLELVDINPVRRSSHSVTSSMNCWPHSAIQAVYWMIIPIGTSLQSIIFFWIFDFSRVSSAVRCAHGRKWMINSLSPVLLDLNSNKYRCVKE